MADVVEMQKSSRRPYGQTLVPLHWRPKMRMTFWALLACMALSVFSVAILGRQFDPQQKMEEERFVGTWQCTSGRYDGKDFPKEFAALLRETFHKSGLGRSPVVEISEPGKIDVAL